MKIKFILLLVLVAGNCFAKGHGGHAHKGHKTKGGSDKSSTAFYSVLSK